MNVQRWINKQQKIWEELEYIINKISADGLQGLSKIQIHRLGSLYKLVSGDLSRARHKNVSRNIFDYLNRLVAKAHNYIYLPKQASIKDLIYYFSTVFPATVRRNSLYIGISFAVFLLGAAVAMTYVHYYSGETENFFVDPYTISKIDKGILWTDRIDHGSVMSTFIMTNNIKIAFLAFAYGLLFGLGSLFILWTNGFSIGGTLQVVIEHNLGVKLLTFMSAHGVIELTTIFISGGAGFMIGWALIDPGPYKRWDAIKLKIREAGYLILGCIPLLIIAGLIEGFISLNANLPDMIKYTISGLSAFLLILYFLFAGQEVEETSKT